LNDADVDGDSLTVASVGSAGHGDIVDNGDGTLTYTPEAGYSGTDVFSYTANDGAADSNSATVSVIVNPVAGTVVAQDDTATAVEDTPVSINVLANDTSTRLFILNISGVVQPANGTVVVTGTTVVYTPAPDYDGLDTFTYTASDGGLGSDSATVSVTVIPVNDGPDAINDSASTNEDTVVEIDVLANDSDVDGDSLTVASLIQPNYGAVTISGTVVLYRPQSSFNGADSFSYTISDGNGGLDSAVVEVTVLPVNDPPDAVTDSATTAEDTAVIIDVLANDSDVDGDTLTINRVSQGTHGTVVVTAAKVVYTPVDDFNGSDAFFYAIADGAGGTDSAVVRVTVAQAEDGLHLVQDAIITALNTPVVLDVLANDVDPDGHEMCVTVVGQAGNGVTGLNQPGTVTYNPNTGFSGADWFTYTVSSPCPLQQTMIIGSTSGGDYRLPSTSSDTITVTVIVDPNPALVTALDDSWSTLEDTAMTLAVLGNDSSSGGNPMSIVGVTKPAHGWASILGSTIVYVPDTDFYGTEVFTYTVSDGAGADSAAVTIMVTAVNDAPDAVSDDVSTDEETPVTVNPLSNDSDADGDNVTIDTVIQARNGSVIDNGDGTVTYTPETDFSGADSYLYVISDGVLTGTGIVSVTVANVNDAPDAWDDVALTQYGNAVTIAVLANDYDADGDAMSIASVGPAAHGTVVDNGDGSVTYTPDSGHVGEDSFTYTASDGLGGSDTATVHLTVAAKQFTLYLPMMRKTHFAAPDLVVEQISASGDSITVVIKNTGDAAVGTDEEFWVDVYIDPDSIPTGVNQKWETLSEEGLRWGVTASALPLAPGGEIVLTIGDEYYWPSLSNFGGSLPAGTVVYAHVDSLNAFTTYGAVLEGHEKSWPYHGAYNNISGMIATAGSAATRQPIPASRAAPTMGNLPPVP